MVDSLRNNFRVDHNSRRRKGGQYVDTVTHQCTTLIIGTDKLRVWFGLNLYWPRISQAQSHIDITSLVDSINRYASGIKLVE